MRGSVLLMVVVGVAMWGPGETLRCYSCPGGSSGSCENIQQCDAAEDTCLTLNSPGQTYSKCLRYADCDFDRLAATFPSGTFTFKCCQSNLCNSAHTTPAEPLIGLLVALAAVWWGMY